MSVRTALTNHGAYTNAVKDASLDSGFRKATAFANGLPVWGCAYARAALFACALDHWPLVHLVRCRGMSWVHPKELPAFILTDTVGEAGSFQRGVGMLQYESVLIRGYGHLPLGVGSFRE